MSSVGRRPSPKFTILYYHAVPAKYREVFSNQMDILRRWAHAVPASYRGQLAPDKTHVAITFDDAFLSVAENALPELAKRSLHATIFVPAGLLGCHPNWSMEDNEADKEEIVMTAEELRKLPEGLVTLGAHSITHPRLARISKDNARLEIEGSRNQLQNLTGKDIELFAFPYGDYDSIVVDLCKEAGYDHVYSIEPQMIDASGSDILRGRTKVELSDSELEFFLKLHGAYCWMPLASSIKRRLVSICSFRASSQ
jgi:peptidoglycan/xylan/chitin deacetylase (PgdA/CDA1 family)